MLRTLRGYLSSPRGGVYGGTKPLARSKTRPRRGQLLEAVYLRAETADGLPNLCKGLGDAACFHVLITQIEGEGFKEIGELLDALPQRLRNPGGVLAPWRSPVSPPKPRKSRPWTLGCRGIYVLAPLCHAAAAETVHEHSELMLRYTPPPP